MSIWSKKLNLNFQNNNDDSDTDDDDWSKEIDDEFIRISEIDTAQLIDGMQNLMPQCPEFADLLADQIWNNKPGDPQRRRWRKSTIKKCMAMWTMYV